MPTEELNLSKEEIIFLYESEISSHQDTLEDLRFVLDWINLQARDQYQPLLDSLDKHRLLRAQAKENWSVQMVSIEPENMKG